jgi:hypothetical protein
MTPEAERARKRRNVMLALAIAGFVLLVFVVTIVRIRAGILAGAG